MRKRRWGGEPGEASTATGRRIANTAALQLAGRAANIGVGVLAVALLARALGPEGFGVWSTALAFVGIFGVLADLGLVQVATQRMSTEPEREGEWLGALFGSVALASVASLLITVAAVPLLGGEDDIQLVTVILALTLLTAAPGALLAVFDARVRAGLRMGLMGINSLVWLATIVVLRELDAGILAFAVGFAANGILSGLLEWGTARRFARLDLRQGRRLWRPLLRVGLPLGLAGVLVTIYYRIDSVLLFTLDGPEEAGVYGAAYRFLDPLHFFPASLMIAAFPVIAAVHGRDPERLTRLVQRSGEYLVIAALGVLGVTVALSDQIVELLLGSGFERTAGLLPILMLAFTFISIGYLAGYLVPVVGLQWRLVTFAAVGVVANVGLNLILIPPYGAFGAAWATVVTEAVVNLLALFVVFRRLEFRPGLGGLARALLAAGSMTAATAALAQIGFAVAILAAGPIYLAALVALRVVVPSEVRDMLGRTPA